MWQVLARLVVVLCISAKAFAQEVSAPLASLPLLRDDAGSSFPVGRILVVLVIACAVVVIVAQKKNKDVPSPFRLLAKRLGASRPISIQVISSLSLGRRTVMYDIEWEGRRLLIATTDTTSVKLSEVTKRMNGSEEFSDTTASPLI